MGTKMKMHVTGLSLALGMFAYAGIAAAATSWPSVSQQLSADQVRPGSALESLIRANQDFDLLRPDELTTTCPECHPGCG